MKHENLDNCIHSLCNTESVKKESVKFYTYSGLEDQTDNEKNPVTLKDDNRVLAKKVIRCDGTIRYSIRVDRDRKLYNPNVFNITSKEEKKFRNVNNKAFEYYIGFLRTKNQSLLLNAERESE